MLHDGPLARDRDGGRVRRRRGAAAAGAVPHRRELARDHATGSLLALFLGIVPTAVAYLLFARGLKHLSAAETATLTLAEPLTATLLGVIVLSESLQRARGGRRGADPAAGCSSWPRPKCAGRLRSPRDRGRNRCRSSSANRDPRGERPAGSRLVEAELTAAVRRRPALAAGGAARAGRRGDRRDRDQPRRPCRPARRLRRSSRCTSCGRRSRSRRRGSRSSARPAPAERLRRAGGARARVRGRRLGRDQRRAQRAAPRDRRGGRLAADRRPRTRRSTAS